MRLYKENITMAKLGKSSAVGVNEPKTRYICTKILPKKRNC